MRSLSSVREGETVRISGIDYDDGSMRNAMELGFYKGEEVEVMKKNFFGTILKVKGSTYGVGKDITDRINVRDC